MLSESKCLWEPSEEEIMLSVPRGMLQGISRFLAQGFLLKEMATLYLESIPGGVSKKHFTNVKCACLLIQPFPF